MPTFVLMTKLAPDALRDAEGRKSMGKRWIDQVHKSCPDVKFVAHYALLGPYDFMDIYEAPDTTTAQRVSLISRAGGAVTAESWPAEPYDHFLSMLEGLDTG
jgi:uncharacterized protein with GYD domain